MSSLMVKHLCLLLSQIFKLCHSFIVFLALTQAFRHTILQFYNSMHKMFSLVKVCAHYTQRYIVVETNIGETLLVKKAKDVVCTLKIRQRV